MLDLSPFEYFLEDISKKYEINKNHPIDNLLNILLFDMNHLGVVNEKYTFDEVYYELKDYINTLKLKHSFKIINKEEYSSTYHNNVEFTITFIISNKRYVIHIFNEEDGCKVDYLTQLWSLSNTEQLFIRACKSRDPNKRLLSVYKRFYYRHSDDKDIFRCLIKVLPSLVEQTCKISIMEIINDLDPNNIKHRVGISKSYDYYEEVLLYLINKLRFLEHDELINLGYRTPRKFR